MSMPEPQPEQPRRRRRWFQYSLRTLLLVMFLTSIGLSWFAVRLQQARRQREGVEEIKKLGGVVCYDYEAHQSGKPPGPGWLRKLLGDDFFAEVDLVQVSNDAAMEHLNGLPRLSAVVCDTRVTDVGLEQLKGLTQLRELYLEYLDVTDIGLEHLKALTQLQALYLSGTRVTDAGLDHLKALTQLRKLTVEDTRVTDQGVKKLQQNLPNCKITR